MNLGFGLRFGAARAASSQNWTEVAFPNALLQPSIPGYVYDPTSALNTVLSNGTGGVPGIGSPVGSVRGYNPDIADLNLLQTVDASRPIIGTKGGKTCFTTNGIDQHVTIGSVPGQDWGTVPKALTMFAMLWRDDAVPATDTSPFAINRAEVSTSFNRWFSLNSTIGLHGHARFGGTIFVLDLVGLAAFPVGSWVEVICEMDVQAISVDGVGTQTGTLKYWINDLAVVSHNILPDKASTANISVQTRVSVGCQFASTTAQQFWAGAIGRCGFMYRTLNDSERAQLRNWMRGTVYIAP